MAGANGGKREGAGRKKGSKNKRTTALAAAVASQLGALPEGFKEPLEIMLEVANTPKPLQDISPELKDQIATDPLVALEYVNLQQGHHKLIMDAAKNAAPYRHARLSSHDVEGGGSSEHIAAVTGKMVEEQPEGESDD